jgi:hypothetical protein
MKSSIAIAFFVILLTGCIPLRQEKQVSGPPHPAVLLCDDRYVLLDMDMRREKILVEQSHMTDPKGNRYSIRVQPHHYDIQQNFAALRPEVYPCNDDGSPLRRWSNGVWSFHFVVQTNSETGVIDQQWKYWTFCYNPIIHGPPN